MEDPSSSSQRPPPAAKLSRTPSWVMLGFLLGAVFVWLLLRPAVNFKAQPAPSAGLGVSGSKSAQTVASPRSGKGVEDEVLKMTLLKAKPAAPRQLSVVEAVFDEYGKAAVWERNRTELALWNAEKGAFADFYEVYREDGVYFFRSLAVLTRPLLTVADHPELPLLFTETEALRRERLEALRNLVPVEALKPERVPQVAVEAPAP